MASCMYMPRQGKLDQLYHVSEFLKKKHNYIMVFDHTDPDVGDAQCVKEYWNDTVYGEFHEDLPPNAPQYRGFGFKMQVFIDAGNSGHSVTHIPRKGFIYISE